MKLILASQSPRRRQMIESLGLQPKIQPADIDETPLAGEPPLPHVIRLARSKAQAIESKDRVLAADTIVVLGQRILGKPKDFADFYDMMRALSGQTHQVHTAWCLRHDQALTEGVGTTSVSFARLSDLQIQAYWDSGEPKDKAGGYGIQGMGGLFVERIEGDFNNVVGLPLREVAFALAKSGLNPWNLDAR